MLNKFIMRSILKDIKFYFEFLFEAGYQIYNVHYPEEFGFWSVKLASSQCIIEIYNERKAITVLFMPIKGDRNKGIGLESMIFFLSNGEILIGTFRKTYLSRKQQFEYLAVLLKQYLDQIVPYFGVDFYNYEKDLWAAQKNYNSASFELFEKEAKISRGKRNPR